MSRSRKATLMNGQLVRVADAYKSFKVPKEPRDTLRRMFVRFFRPPHLEIHHVLNGVNLEVNEGDWLGLVGRNGSGKSTLLKLLAGVYQLDKGSIDITPSVAPFIELGIGLSMELTVRDNIFLNGTIMGLTRREISDRFDDILEFSEQAEFVDAPLKKLSSGMKAKVAFAISAHVDSDLYLLDEIGAVGDYKFREKCANVFDQMRQSGKSAIIVSHSRDSLKTWCNRAVWLDGGKIVADGDPESVWEAYTSKD